MTSDNSSVWYDYDLTFESDSGSEGGKFEKGEFHPEVEVNTQKFHNLEMGNCNLAFMWRIWAQINIQYLMLVDWHKSGSSMFAHKLMVICPAILEILGCLLEMAMRKKSVLDRMNVSDYAKEKGLLGVLTLDETRAFHLHFQIPINQAHDRISISTTGKVRDTNLEAFILDAKRTDCEIKFLFASQKAMTSSTGINTVGSMRGEFEIDLDPLLIILIKGSDWIEIAKVLKLMHIREKECLIARCMLSMGRKDAHPMCTKGEEEIFKLMKFKGTTALPRLVLSSVLLISLRDEELDYNPSWERSLMMHKFQEKVFCKVEVECVHYIPEVLRPALQLSDISKAVICNYILSSDVGRLVGRDQLLADFELTLAQFRVLSSPSSQRVIDFLGLPLIGCEVPVFNQDTYPTEAIEIFSTSETKATEGEVRDLNAFARDHKLFAPIETYEDRAKYKEKLQELESTSSDMMKADPEFESESEYVDNYIKKQNERSARKRSGYSVVAEEVKGTTKLGSMILIIALICIFPLAMADNFICKGNSSTYGSCEYASGLFQQQNYLQIQGGPSLFNCSGQSKISLIVYNSSYVNSSLSVCIMISTSESDAVCDNGCLYWNNDTSKIHPNNTLGKCTGDATYCNQTTCDLLSICNCSVWGYKRWTEYSCPGYLTIYNSYDASTIETLLFTLNSTDYLEFDDEDPVSWLNFTDDQDDEILSLKRYYPTPIYGKNVFVNVADRLITIQQLSPLQDLMIFLKKDDVSVILLCNDTSCSFIIPERCFLISGYLDVMVTDGGTTIMYQASSYLYSTITCIRSTKILWFFDYASWDCFTASEKLIALVFLGLIVWFFLAILRWVWIILVWIFLFVTLPFRVARDLSREVIKSNTYRKLIKFYFDYMDASKADIEVNRSNIPVPSESTARKDPLVFEIDMIPEHFKGQGAYVNRNGKYLYAVAFLCLLTLSSAQHCTSGVSMSFSDENCIKYVNGTTTCTGVANLRGTIPFVGSSICFNLVSGNTVMGTGEMIYNGMINTVQMSIDYYTSSWVLNTQDLRSCPIENQCSAVDDGKCPTNYRDKTYWGSFTNPLVIGYPGRFGCTEDAGGWAGGCFFGARSCVYWAYGLVPVGKIFTVYTPISSLLSPNVTLNIGSISATTLLTNAPITVGTVTMKVLGSLEGDHTLFGSKKVIVSDDAYICTASERNAPVAGTIGEIQASSSNFLQTKNTQAFLFSDDIVHGQLTGGKMILSTRGPSIHNNDSPLPLCSTLPSLYGGNHWYFDEGYLKSHLTSPGAIEISATTTSEFTFTTFRVLVCPKMEKLVASGCYSCSLGSVVNISVWSTCMSGSCSVRIFDQTSDVTPASIVVNSKSIDITTEADDGYVYFSTSVPDNKLRLCLDCGGGGLYCESFDFIAKSDVTIKNETWKPSSNAVTRPATLDLHSALFSSSWWDDLFTFKTPIWQSFITYAVLALSVILAVFLLPFVVKNVSLVINSIQRTMRVRKDKWS